MTKAEDILADVNAYEVRAIDSALDVAKQNGFTEGAASRTAEVDALNSQVKTLTAQLTAAQTQASTDKSTITGLQTQLKAAQDALAASEKALAALQKKYDDYVASHPDVVTPPPVVTPPAAKTLFGYWAGSDPAQPGATVKQSYDRVAGYLGGPQVYRMFYPSLPQANFVGSNADFGPPVVVSFKIAPTDVIAGKQDAYLRSWFASIPATRQVWWSYFHEPENDIEAGAFTAQQYRDAWDHILALAPVQDNLHPTLILMEFTLRKTSRKVADYVSEGLKKAKNGVLAWDAYLTGETSKAKIDKIKASSASFGLKWGIAETSVAETFNLPGMTHEQTVKSHVQALKAITDADFVTWFETSKSDGNWLMKPYPTAVTEWKK